MTNKGIIALGAGAAVIAGGFAALFLGRRGGSSKTGAYPKAAPTPTRGHPRTTPTPHGTALVIYSSDSRDTAIDQGTFRAAARVAGRALDVQAVPISSAGDLLTAIHRAPENLGVVVFIGHGTPTKFFSPSRFGVRTAGRGGTVLPCWISPTALAEALAPKLLDGATVSLAGCSTARSPSEPSGWSVATGWHGGADSFASAVRDALVRAGASGRVLGHVVHGGTLANPQGRTFYIRRDQVGQPGRHVMAIAGGDGPPDFDAYYDWNTYAQGTVASAWMLGQPLERWSE